MCRLRQVIAQEQERLTPTGRLPVRVAVGLAVPCLEAWLRCGHDRGVTEAAWRVALRENKFPYDSRRLKQAVYGTDRPSIHLETQHMVEEAQRLASRLSELETWFPGGFKPFADAVRSWVPPATPQPPAETS
jgi:hypothetical protein